MFKLMKGIKRIENIMSKYIRTGTCMKSMIEKSSEAKLKWLGHI